MKLEAYIDGGSRGNPGEAGCGVFFPGVVRIAEYLGTGTNNFAEYSALLAALRFAVFSRCEQLTVYADSELVVRQIKGEYQVRNDGIRPLYDSAIRWIALIPSFSISHVRREQNKDADMLANLAMDKRCNSVQWEANAL
jgi:ribonuclease HI